jgi:hypothetical protein
MSFRVLIKFNQRFVASLLLLTIVLGTALTVAPIARADNGAGQGIQVSPVIIDLNGEKGGSYNLKLTVTNVTAGTLVLKSAVNDFKAKDETGNPQVILDNSNDSSSYSMKNWVGPVPELTLASKESRSLTVTVNIPSNAEAGGHYGVIRFSGVPPALSGQSVSLTASVGVLLLTRVDGKITENLVLKSLTIQQNGKSTSLVSNGPVNILTRIENTGNVHLKPIGTLTVKDTFGKVVATYPFGGPTKNILPQSTRAYNQTFDKKFLFGRYTAQLQAAYGTSGAVLLGSTSFWVIPYKLIIFLIVGIALAIILIRRLVHSYNRRVIHRSQNPKNKQT